MKVRHLSQKERDLLHARHPVLVQVLVWLRPPAKVLQYHDPPLALLGERVPVEKALVGHRVRLLVALDVCVVAGGGQVADSGVIQAGKVSTYR